MKNCSIDHHLWTHCMCHTDGVHLQCTGWKSVVRLGDGLCFNPVWYGRIRTPSHCRFTLRHATGRDIFFLFLKGCQGAYLGVLTVSFVAQACALSPLIQRNRERSRPLFAAHSSAPFLFSFLSNATASVETALKPLTRVFVRSPKHWLKVRKHGHLWLFTRCLWEPALLWLTVL